MVTTFNLQAVYLKEENEWLIMLLTYKLSAFSP